MDLWKKALIKILKVPTGGRTRRTHYEKKRKMVKTGLKGGVGGVKWVGFISLSEEKKRGAMERERSSLSHASTIVRLK